jgi:hypothetical protein
MGLVQWIQMKAQIEFTRACPQQLIADFRSQLGKERLTVRLDLGLNDNGLHLWTMNAFHNSSRGRSLGRLKV